MKIEQVTIKKINVKRVFFEENGGQFPFFELENGEIKMPVYENFTLTWLTEDEFRTKYKNNINSPAHSNSNLWSRLFGWLLPSKQDNQ